MGSLESLKKQAKTREEIRIETRELKRTEETNGCYNPFNIVHQEVQRRLKEKWIPDPVVLPLIVDLKDDDAGLFDESVRQKKRAILAEGRLEAIKKLCNRLKQKYRGYEYAQVRIAIDEILAVLLKEGDP